MALCLLVALADPARAEGADVPVWIYHDFPPYVVDAEQESGLSFDLARLLTKMSDRRFRFLVTVLPRERLNQRLQAGQQGIVMWANHAWFGDSDRTRFLWTDAVLADRNSVISPREVAFEYDGPRSLTGMTMVAVRGHRYPGVDRLVDYDLVKRIDVRSERSLVQFVASGRGRVAIAAESAVHYFVQEFGLQNAVHISEQPHSRYERYIMIQPGMTDVHDFLKRAVAELSHSPTWADIMESYGAAVAVTP